MGKMFSVWMEIDPFSFIINDFKVRCGGQILFQLGGGDRLAVKQPRLSLGITTNFWVNSMCLIKPNFE
jgi:hypothetical protein